MSPLEDRSQLPRGTVTLLFTDIEGSTNALRALGGAYNEALGRHHDLVRTACARFGGIEVDTQGDAFFVAFGRAHEAVAAALEAQRALLAEPWPEARALRVRMGIHTGEPDLGEHGYVGIDVHLAARICGAAHGGQVLCSRATRDLAAGGSGDGVAYRDLGDHRLKDFDRPVRLFQVDGAGIPAEHPPPRTGSAVGLIVPSNRLVGREPELAAVRELLAAPDVHLVTLTGPGGTGKSRLALELAWEAVEQFADGVFLVRLAQVGDPALVPSAIAEALGVREAGTRPLLEAIADDLRDRELLLVVDNFEHVLEAALLLAALFEASAGVRLLATSRVPLRLRGEHVVDVEPLPEEDATSLFVERARSVDHRFDAEAEAETVAEICRRLDGLPLAIELAAARVAVLTPKRLLERIGLALLSGGGADVPERQRTISATIEWSYDLLTPSQQALHAALGIFAGGCTLEAVEEVCGSADLLDDLAALVAGGLIRRDDSPSEPRFRMLQVVREFALARLSADGRAHELGAAHAAWVARLGEQAETELTGGEQAVWLERLDQELPNVRAALEWSLANGEPELALRIAASLGRFWRARGHVTEGRRWLEAALADADEVPAEARAAGFWAAGRQAMAQGDDAAAVPLLERALELYRELGRRREESFALAELGLAAVATGDLEQGEQRCADALEVARALGDPRATSAALSQLAHVVGELGDHARARALHEEALGLRRRLGDPLLVANAANNLGFAALAEGDLVRARTALEEALALATDLGDRIHTASARCGLGQTALLAGEPDRAAAHLTAALDTYVVLGDERDAAECISGLAAAAAALGRPSCAAALWAGADALRHAPATGVAATIESRYRPTVIESLDAEELERANAVGASLRLDRIVPAELVPLPDAVTPQ
jgi:predicted ATPase/class 3 adenylate cyclase